MDDNNIMTLMYNMNEYITSIDVVVGISKTKGFLILLGDVISNFGCYLNDVYVDSFFRILLVLLEYYTNVDDNSIVIKNDDVDVKEDDVDVEDEENDIVKEDDDIIHDHKNDNNIKEEDDYTDEEEKE